LHLGATNIKVRSRGSEHPLILFVGEAPGKDEDAKGECFVGKAGKEFDKFLDLVGLPKEACRWTNAVRCIPWNDTRETFRAPTQDEIDACADYLEAEIITKDPVFVVPLGNSALHALIPKAPNISKARKRKFFVELPSVRNRYNKAKAWCQVRGYIPTTYTWPDTEKSQRQFIALAEHKGMAHIETNVYTVYPTFHPSAAARGNPTAEAGIVEDLGYIRTKMTGDRGIPFEDYECLITLEDIREHFELIKALYRAGKLSEICIDLETTGLSPYLLENPLVVLFAISYGEGKAFAIPFDHHDSPFVKDILAKKAIIAMLQDLLEEVPIVNHNLKFDLHWMALMGLDVVKFTTHGDSMLSAWTLWNDTVMDHTLESLATRHVGMIAHKEEMDEAKQDAYDRLQDAGEDREPTMDDIDIEIVYKYCCADTDSALRLFKKFEDMLKETEQYDAHHLVCAPAIIPTAMMEIPGIRCDVELLQKSGRDLEAQLANYQQQLVDMGYDKKILEVLNERQREKGKTKVVKTFKLTAPAAKTALVFDVLGMTPTSYGKTGPSIDKQVMSALLESCTEFINTPADDDGKWTRRFKILEILRGFSATNTLLTRYIQPVADYVDRNGIIHPNFNIRATATGRYSSSKPSFHQMPWRSSVKSAFVPHHPHGLIISADYSQMELRVFASLAGEETMIAAFESGQDIHRMIAAMLLHKAPEDVLTAERRRIKTCVFGMIYGRGAKSIAAQEHISEAEAQELIDKVFAQFPKLKEWIKGQHKYGKKYNKVYSPFGFRRLLDRSLSDVERNNRAVNTPVQGSASDIGVRGFTHVHTLLHRGCSKFRSTLFGQVHDSILMSSYPGELYDMLVLCRKGMVQMPQRELHWLRAPLKVDFEVGPSWGELCEVELLPDRMIKFDKVKPDVHAKICEIFMSWSNPPDLIEEQHVLEMEDGSQLFQSLTAVKTREAVKEEFVNSTWQFPAFQAAS
jgi:uracil-DNA glycosylase family 4